jgi:hypothetical protein
MEHTRIPLQAYKYQPSGKRDIYRPRRRWREATILEVGTVDSLKPLSVDDDDDVSVFATACAMYTAYGPIKFFVF